MAVALIHQYVSKKASHFLEILGKCFAPTKQGMTIRVPLAPQILSWYVWVGHTEFIVFFESGELEEWGSMVWPLSYVCLKIGVHYKTVF